MIKEIAFMGYPVSNVKKAREFYEGVLGLTPSDEFGPITEETNFIEYNIGAQTLSIGCMPEWLPSKDGPSAAFEVEDFDAAIAKFKEHNVAFMMEPQQFPTCSMAVVRDPDQNLITIHKRKNG